MSKISRRKFLSAAFGGAIVATAAYGYYQYNRATYLSDSSGSLETTSSQITSSQISSPTTENAAYLSVARGESPAKMVEAAIEAIGGIRRFVKPGNDLTFFNFFKDERTRAQVDYCIKFCCNVDILGYLSSIFFTRK